MKEPQEAGEAAEWNSGQEDVPKICGTLTHITLYPENFPEVLYLVSLGNICLKLLKITKDNSKDRVNGEVGR